MSYIRDLFFIFILVFNTDALVLLLIFKNMSFLEYIIRILFLNDNVDEEGEQFLKFLKVNKFINF